MPRLSVNNKTSVIQRALITRQKLVMLEFHLRLVNNTTDADACKAKGDDIQAEIDAMLGQAMDEWRAQANTLVTELGDINAKLQASIAQIKKDVATAQNVVKALGLVDEAIALIKKLALA
jgi:hypothetical protein